jgi:tRNA-2-methylthio-N6-dimethylallyladenosine synthase
LPEEEKARRLSILQEKQKSITLKKNRTLVGKTMAVLVEGESKKDPLHVSGRSGTNKVVNFEGPLGLQGKIVLVKILTAHPHSLFGCLT